ncbi:MAG: hypothetical protein PHG41_04880 [Actinomycetota bacterium]|nr:hypothetical protein [Actinomycetota bacterium]
MRRQILLDLNQAGNNLLVEINEAFMKNRKIINIILVVCVVAGIVF